MSWGDLNTVILHLHNPWNQQVADLLASFGLVNLLIHFRQRLHLFHMQKPDEEALEAASACTRKEYI